MANTSTKTRIILKNDDLSNWQGSNLSLHAGEIALALREDGSYEMKIGTGDKTWSQLTGTNFVISADQVLGLQQSIAELSTSHYEVTSIAGISLTGGGGNYNNGDTAVVKTLIAGEGANAKYSYTAYVFDSSLTVETATDTQSPSGSWRAMDGNYNAENIYFDSDISCAGSYTQVGNINKTQTGVTTIASKGKSLEKVMETIFTKELTGTTTKPSITKSSLSTVEYGTALTVNYSLTFNHGSYQYGPSPVGTQLSSWEVKTNGTLLDYSNICNDVVTQNTVAASPSTLTATFSQTTTLVSDIYEVSAKAGYTEASALPQTNLGGDDETASNFISGGTTTTSGKLYRVYRPRYVMMTNSFQEPPTEFDADELSAAPTLTGTTITLTSFNTWYKMTDNNWPIVINVKNNYYNVFFAAPKGIKSNWTAKKSDNVNVLPTTENPSDADMSYKNGDTGTYSVYQINNLTPYDDNKCNITWVN